MRRLLLFVLVVVAAWYGWGHRDLLRERPADEVVVMNHSGRAIERLRLSVGDRTSVVETLEDGASTRFAWRCERDGPWKAVWEIRRVDVERQWTGGGYHPSEGRSRHTFEFMPDERVIWQAESLSPANTGGPAR